MTFILTLSKLRLNNRPIHFQSICLRCAEGEFIYNNYLSHYYQLTTKLLLVCHGSVEDVRKKFDL